jgi:hypothetical protein
VVPIRHFYIAGYLVHHLFFGIMIEVPAAFVLAFGMRRPAVAVLAPIALGIGSAMILDEVFYLIATEATSQDYRSSVSVWGAVILISMATGLLLGLYALAGRKPEDSPS